MKPPSSGPRGVDSIRARGTPAGAAGLAERSREHTALSLADSSSAVWPRALNRTVCTRASSHHRGISMPSPFPALQLLHAPTRRSSLPRRRLSLSSTTRR